MQTSGDNDPSLQDETTSPPPYDLNNTVEQADGTEDPPAYEAINFRRFQLLEIPVMTRHDLDTFLYLVAMNASQGTSDLLTELRDSSRASAEGPGINGFPAEVAVDNICYDAITGAIQELSE